MPMVTDRVLEYARERYRNMITEWLLDDPSDLLHPIRDQEPPEVIRDIRELGSDLGLDYDELVATGHQYERQRLVDIESGKIKPAPREEPGS